MKMQKFKATLLLAGLTTFLAGAIPTADASEATFEAISKATVENHILPRYQQLVSAGVALSDAATGYCADRNEAGFKALDAAFRAYWMRWADIRHIQFGPVTYLNRNFRIQFWPDTRNRIEKQLAQTLAGADKAALAQDRFAKTSVAIQGLPALERLLDKGNAGYEGADGAFRCDLTVAVARNLQIMSEAIYKDWNPSDGYASYIAEAGTGSGPYAEAYEVPVDILQSLLGEIEASRDVRLGRPMGSAIDKARPKLAEAWRSGLSLAILTHSVAGAEDLYLNGGFDKALTDAGETGLAGNIRDLFKQSEASIAAIKGPLYDAFTSEDGRKQLETVRAELKALAALIGTDLAVALDISPGFNSRDGD